MSQQPMKQYWVTNKWELHPELGVIGIEEDAIAVYLAADVEAVEALRRLTQAECLGLRRALMDIANYPHTGDDLKNLIACEDIARKALQEPFTGEALLDALAAKEARIGELERFKQYVHRCVEEHGSYKP